MPFCVVSLKSHEYSKSQYTRVKENFYFFFNQVCEGAREASKVYEGIVYSPPARRFSSEVSFKVYPFIFR